MSAFMRRQSTSWGRSTASASSITVSVSLIGRCCVLSPASVPPPVKILGSDIAGDRRGGPPEIRPLGSERDVSHYSCSEKEAESSRAGSQEQDSRLSGRVDVANASESQRRSSRGLRMMGGAHRWLVTARSQADTASCARPSGARSGNATSCPKSGIVTPITCSTVATRPSAASARGIRRKRNSAT